MARGRGGRVGPPVGHARSWLTIASKPGTRGRVAEPEDEGGVTIPDLEVPVDRVLNRLHPLAIGALAVVVLILGWLAGLAG